MRAKINPRWQWLAAAVLLAGVLIGLLVFTTTKPVAADLTAPTQDDPNVQLAHLAPFAMDPNTAVTITIGGGTPIADVEFADSTAYFTVTAAMTQEIEIAPVIAAPITSMLELTQDMDYTVLAIGGANNWPVEVVTLTDDNTTPTTGTARVRIGHYAPFAPNMAMTAVDVRLQDGTVITGFENVTYGLTGTIELEAGEYDLVITTPGGEMALIDPLPITLNEGDIVSLFAVGDGMNQPLGIFALPSGAEGALLPLAPRLQAAHLAPFAMDPNTAVTVTLEGDPILPNFEFADSTGYVWLDTGLQDIEVFAGDMTTPVLTATLDLMTDTNYTVLAIGDGLNQDLELLVLTNTQMMPAMGESLVRIGHLAPFTDTLANTEATIRLQDGTILTGTGVITYGTVSDYLSLPAGTYDLVITTPDGTTTLIDPPPFTLMGGEILSLFAVGDGINQPLGVFVLPDGQPGMLLQPEPEMFILYMPIIFKDAMPQE